MWALQHFRRLIADRLEAALPRDIILVGDALNVNTGRLWSGDRQLALWAHVYRGGAAEGAASRSLAEVDDINKQRALRGASPACKTCWCRRPRHSVELPGRSTLRSYAKFTRSRGVLTIGSIAGHMEFS